eukprot:scaffold51060_cov65-Cyclotella_meneghiniana.AAC.8
MSRFHVSNKLFFLAQWVSPCETYYFRWHSTYPLEGLPMPLPSLITHHSSLIHPNYWAAGGLRPKTATTNPRSSPLWLGMRTCGGEWPRNILHLLNV